MSARSNRNRRIESKVSAFFGALGVVYIASVVSVAMFRYIMQHGLSYTSNAMEGCDA